MPANVYVQCFSYAHSAAFVNVSLFHSISQTTSTFTYKVSICTFSFCTSVNTRNHCYFLVCSEPHARRSKWIQCHVHVYLVVCTFDDSYAKSEHNPKMKVWCHFSLSLLLSFCISLLSMRVNELGKLGLFLLFIFFSLRRIIRHSSRKDEQGTTFVVNGTGTNSYEKETSTKDARLEWTWQKDTKSIEKGMR